MYLDSSTTKSLQSAFLSRSTNLLKQGIARRTFIKTLIGLAIVGVESELVACSSTIPVGVELFTYKGHTDFVFAAAWSPQRQYIASGGADKTVQVWNAIDGTLQHPTYHYPTYVTAIAWSPDGNHVAAGGDYGTVYIWDTTSSTEEPV
jgi:WD40 repeat protein